MQASSYYHVNAAHLTLLRLLFDVHAAAACDHLATLPSHQPVHESLHRLRLVASSSPGFTARLLHSHLARRTGLVTGLIVGLVAGLVIGLVIIAQFSLNLRGRST